MGASVDNNYNEPITLCAVLNGLRQQRVKHLTLNYESHLGETVQIAVKCGKSVGTAGEIAEAFADIEPHSNS